MSPTSSNSSELHSKAPKAPVNKKGESEIIKELRSLESNFELDSFYQLAFKNLNELDLELSLFLVYTTWKNGNLEELDSHTQDSFVTLTNMEFIYVKEFLKIHILRCEGKTKESFQRLESLNKDCDNWVIHFRFASESLNFYDLNKAATIVKKYLYLLPKEAKLIQNFNLGIIALNKNNITIFNQIENQFRNDSYPLAQYFHTWLQGGYYQNKGKPQLSVKYYQSAIEQATQLSTRKIDLPILAFMILQQSIWAGDIDASRKSWKIIELESIDKNSISRQNLTLATALYEINEGKLSEALIRIKSLFESNEWNKEQLHAGDYYIWILLGFREINKGKQLLRNLADVREKYGFNKLDLEHEAITYYFDYLNQDLTLIEYQKNLLNIIDELKIKDLEKELNIVKFLFYLTQEDFLEKAQAFTFISTIPFMQLIGVIILSKQNYPPSFFRQLKESLTTEIAKALLDLHLGRITEDLYLFARSFKNLSKLRATTWAQLMDSDNLYLNSEFGRSLQNVDLLIDHEARRVIALETMETLDTQSHLTELTLSLLRSPNGLNKETASLGIGYDYYDPIQHDPIIYNLISRLRDWLRKQGTNIKINAGTMGWYLTNQDLIKNYSLNLSVPTQSLNSKYNSSPSKEGVQLTPRLNWILNNITIKGFIIRSDLLSQFPIKKSTAANDFNILIQQKLIQRHGNGRGIYYTLVEKIT